MLEFNKDLHQYTFNGEILPSVSQVMSPLSSIKYGSIDPSVLEKARVRGTGVHEAIDNYLTFGIIDDQYADYVEQFKTWINKSGMVVLANEYIVTNGSYCGTVDLVVSDRYGKVYVVDMKVTSKIHDDLLGVQLYAYRNLVEQFVEISGCYVLWLKPNKYQFKPIRPDKETWEELFEKFKNEGNGNKPKD